MPGGLLAGWGSQLGYADAGWGHHGEEAVSPCVHMAVAAPGCPGLGRAPARLPRGLLTPSDTATLGSFYFFPCQNDIQRFFSDRAFWGIRRSPAPCSPEGRCLIGGARRSGRRHAPGPGARDGSHRHILLPQFDT